LLVFALFQFMFRICCLLTFNYYYSMSTGPVNRDLGKGF
jgi:hypothetical protein